MMKAAVALCVLFTALMHKVDSAKSHDGCAPHAKKPLVVCTGQRTDLVVVVDSSGSIKKHNFALLKQFLVELVQELDISANETHVGIISYSTDVRVEFPLNRYTTTEDVVKGIEKIQYMSELTYTYRALRALRHLFKQKNGARTDVSKVAIVITDGKSANMKKTARIAKKCQKDGITMIALGITKYINMNELNSIATDPDKVHTYTVTKFTDLSKIIRSLGTTTCNAAKEEAKRLGRAD